MEDVEFIQTISNFLQEDKMKIGHFNILANVTYTIKINKKD